MDLKELYNNVVSYWWPNSNENADVESQEKEDMSVIARLTRLRNLMRESNYEEMHREQICNFYSKLIKEYPNSKSTFKYPIFLFEPPIYKPKICFLVPLILNYLQVKGEIDLFILFEEDLSTTMPSFYIRNPNYDKAKPNKKWVRFGTIIEEGHWYEAVMGGVKILMPEVIEQKWNWSGRSYYKEDNIVNMVRWIHKKLLLDHFPFLKRNKGKQDIISKECKALKAFIQKTMIPDEAERIQIAPLLSNIQDCETLSLSIDLQRFYLYQETEKLKEIQQATQEQNIQYFLPSTIDKRSQQLLQSISSLQALKDTQFFLEKKFYDSQMTLEEFLKLSKKVIQGEFDQMIKISFLEVPQIL